MFCERLFLKDSFPALGEGRCDPFCDAYLLHNSAETQWSARKRPCLIICPGGAYRMCSEREAEPVALTFLADGYNVFVLNYSVAPHRFPHQLREVAAVLELIYRHGEDWHCDVSRVALMGFSAGGHLAAHYANRYACRQVREVFPESRPVQASVLGYPVISAAFSECHRGSFENLLGHFPKTKEEIDFFSCERAVTPQTPPAFLWHNAEDETVPVKNSLEYAKALSANGVEFELHVYPCGGHGWSVCNDQVHPTVTDELEMASRWITDAKRWLRGVLTL